MSAPLVVATSPSFSRHPLLHQDLLARFPGARLKEERVAQGAEGAEGADGVLDVAEGEGHTFVGRAGRTEHGGLRDEAAVQCQQTMPGGPQRVESGISVVVIPGVSRGTMKAL